MEGEGGGRRCALVPTPIALVAQSRCKQLRLPSSAVQRLLRKGSDYTPLENIWNT